jgi:hypothetical protein
MEHEYRDRYFNEALDTDYNGRELGDINGSNRGDSATAGLDLPAPALGPFRHEAVGVNLFAQPDVDSTVQEPADAVPMPAFDDFLVDQWSGVSAASDALHAPSLSPGIGDKPAGQQDRLATDHTQRTIDQPKPRRKKRIPNGYPCTEAECSMLFNSQGDLRKHSRWHLPESQRPHGCDEPNCSRRFVDKRDLRRHQEGVHKRVGARGNRRGRGFELPATHAEGSTSPPSSSSSDQKA